MSVQHIKKASKALSQNDHGRYFIDFSNARFAISWVLFLIFYVADVNTNQQIYIL
jgi:hypothetical protein